MFDNFEMVLILTDQMLPVPTDIHIREDWGPVSCESFHGKHSLMVGKEDVMIPWLKGFSGVMINRKDYAPINKKFELVNFNNL